MFSGFVNLFRCNTLEHCIKAPVSSPADPGRTSDLSFDWAESSSQPVPMTSIVEFSLFVQAASGR